MNLIYTVSQRKNDKALPLTGVTRKPLNPFFQQGHSDDGIFWVITSHSVPQFNADSTKCSVIPALDRTHSMGATEVMSGLLCLVIAISAIPDLKDCKNIRFQLTTSLKDPMVIPADLLPFPLKSPLI